ncbi:hypothetical protein V2I01_01570 [Micromonospora sp. BRA006-A]|nr:hypothetical protein [Micromonospora sp. BRA006-A]
MARFETALAQLEGTAEAVAFASGMAALTATLLAATRDGKRHVVAVRPSTAAPTTSSPPACSARRSPGPPPPTWPARSARHRAGRGRDAGEPQPRPGGHRRARRRRR